MYYIWNILSALSIAYEEEDDGRFKQIKLGQSYSLHYIIIFEIGLLFLLLRYTLFELGSVH